ncbi:MAG TPA: hypothetical protein VLN49_11315 [Gemmatimonadaceae bacterium]|nr:hypothetical protein [Gemmatimonadaceae bacterium]
MNLSNPLPVWPSAIVCGVLLVLPGPCSSQIAYDAPTGRVEVLGLRHWTPAMLKDSIRHYVPGQELHDAACMVTLRDSLHFADASVEHFVMAPPGQPRRDFLTIKVIEPDQAKRVQWDVRRRDEFTSLLPDYAPLILPATDSMGGVWRGPILYWLQFSDSSARAQAMSRASASARGDGERVVTFLTSRRAEADRVRAMRVLARDGLWTNRMVAVAVLSNFPDRDSTWLALAHALRDPHEGVREAAANVLRGLPSRHVDWQGATGDLRLLLGGTNLPAMQTVFELLARTEVAPELAPRLLRDNADWVLEHLGSETPMASDAAHRLLVRLHRGNDLGRTRAAWADWIQRL